MLSGRAAAGGKGWALNHTGGNFTLHCRPESPELTAPDLVSPGPSPPRWPSGKASASRAEEPGFKSRCVGIFSGSSHTSDFKIGTPVATLPGAWRYRVSAGTGRPSVSIL